MRYGFLSRFFARSRVLFLITVCVLGLVIVSYNFVTNRLADEQMIDEVFEYIKKNSLYPIYFEDACREEVKLVIYGDNPIRKTPTTACFDRYSSLEVLPKNWKDKTKPQKVGIGIGRIYKGRMGIYRVSHVYKGGPAYEAGLRDDDGILTMYNPDLDISYIPANSGRAFLLTYGKPGTALFITVRRNGRVFVLGPIVRKYTELQYVIVKESEDGVGYIYIKRFGMGVAKELREALLHFSKDGEHPRVIIDLRNNPGSYSVEAFTSLTWFSEQSDRVLLKYYRQDGIEKLFTADELSTKYSVPGLVGSVGEFSDYRIALLINGGSMSASDIFAAVIKMLSSESDFVVIGVKSYGKGIEQRLKIFSSKVFLKLTTGEYQTGDGVKIHGMGVIPHCFVQDSRWYFDDTFTQRDRQATVAQRLLKSHQKMNTQCSSGSKLEE